MMMIMGAGTCVDLMTGKVCNSEQKISCTLFVLLGNRLAKLFTEGGIGFIMWGTELILQCA